MPNGIGVPILLNVQYRLSRPSSVSPDIQTYNRVICHSTPFVKVSGAYFVEGFNAAEFVVESYGAQWSFRKQTATPQMLYVFDRFRVIGSEINDPMLRERLSISPAPFGLQVNEELAWDDVFSVTFRYCDASWGLEVEAHNATDSNNNTDIEFFDRDVQSVGRQNNLLGERAMITPTPAPEPITEPLLETV